MRSAARAGQSPAAAQGRSARHGQGAGQQGAGKVPQGAAAAQQSPAPSRQSHAQHSHGGARLRLAGHGDGKAPRGKAGLRIGYAYRSKAPARERYAPAGNGSARPRTAPLRHGQAIHGYGEARQAHGRRRHCSDGRDGIALETLSFAQRGGGTAGIALRWLGTIRHRTARPRLGIARRCTASAQECMSLLGGAAAKRSNPSQRLRMAEPGRTRRGLRPPFSFAFVTVDLP